MTREEAIKQLKDASDSEVRYGDIDNRYDEVMKRVEAFEMAIEALKLIPDNATNGEVIKALFPKWQQLNGDHVWLSCDLDDFTHIAYTPDWWNAPYKGVIE